MLGFFFSVLGGGPVPTGFLFIENEIGICLVSCCTVPVCVCSPACQPACLSARLLKPNDL